jgi:hypothetical protein
VKPATVLEKGYQMNGKDEQLIKRPDKYVDDAGKLADELEALVKPSSHNHESFGLSRLFVGEVRLIVYALRRLSAAEGLLWRNLAARNDAVGQLLKQAETDGAGCVLNNKELIAALYSTDRTEFARVRRILIEAGATYEAVMTAAGAKPHDADCACWRCIGRLHMNVVRRNARRTVDTAILKAIGKG